MVELVRRNKLDPGKVVSIEANVIRIAHDFAGGGLYGVDKVVRTKEQADHSLLAVALLDGDVMPAQFEPDRIMRADVQQLLKKVFGPAGSGIYRPISCEDACQDYRRSTIQDWLLGKRCSDQSRRGSRNRVDMP
jgi:MmgE/PrpD C-terminal domain